MVKVFLPNNINLICLNNKYFYLYNLNNFLFFNFHEYNFFFNKHLNIIKLNIKNKVINFKSKKFITTFLFTWDNFFFSKIYFLGKGFKLKKFNKTIHFNFIYSHKNILLNNHTLIKKIEKTKLLLASKNYKSLIELIQKIIKIKPLNSYTKRGLRRTKQIFYKKKNKGNVQ